MINAAIVGLGRWGQNLVNSVHPTAIDAAPSTEIRFTAGVVRDPSKTRDYAEAHGFPLHDNLEAVLTDPAIDALVLATPHSVHAEQIIAAAEAGKHVFTDKPFTLTTASALAAAQACEDNNVTLAVGYNWRFQPALRQIKQMLDDGRLGKLLHMEGNFCGPSVYWYPEDHWRQSADEGPAGGMTGRGVHLLDAMLHLAAPEARANRVYTRSSRRALTYGIDDTTTTLLEFTEEGGPPGAPGAPGPDATISTVIATAETWRLQVFGTNGWAEVGDTDHLHTWQLRTCLLNQANLREKTTPQLTTYPATSTERPDHERDDPRHTFSARSYEWRLHSAPDAIERQLATEVARSGSRHAFVVCSPSIAAKTNTIDRIAEALGDRYAGTFDAIEVDSTYRSTAAATAAARTAGADLLIAIGGGSVIVANRVVDILLCEDGDPFDLMTQYPEGKPAHSPRLISPKLPIINIPTTPTTAMNRAGSGLANPDLDHRMEYFDPKTRPTAIFWDGQLLLTTPFEVIRSTATTTFAVAVSAAAAPDANPLVEGDRAHILRLAKRAYARLTEAPEDIAPRIDLCTAALLQNRAADDDASGATGPRHPVFGGDYALATALHVRYPHVGQGEATSVLAATVARRAPTPDLDTARRVAQLLDAWQDTMTAEQATQAAANAIERTYEAAGMPTRIRDLNIPREDFPLLAEATLKNFNANQGLRDPDQQRRHTLELLEAAW